MYKNFTILEDDRVTSYYDYPMKYFINLEAPKIFDLITPKDEADLYELTRSSASIKKKIRIIDEILLKYPYFKRIGTGTNRLAYLNLDYPAQIIKIAVDKTALQDGPREYVNQKYLAPLCTKIFEISPKNNITSSECIKPFKSYHEFEYYSDMVYDTIMDKFVLSGFLLDDIGFSFYKNWGVRFDTPVLLDFPYLYKFDSFKAFKCKNVIDGHLCRGNLELDPLLNYLVCTKCGKDEIAFSSIGLELNEEKIYRNNNSIIVESSVYSPKIKIMKNGILIKDTSKIQNRTDFIEKLNKNDNRTLEEILKSEF